MRVSNLDVHGLSCLALYPDIVIYIYIVLLGGYQKHLKRVLSTLLLLPVYRSCLCFF